MKIHGLNKLTLLDYPGKVAATIFTGSCSFRCGFCQNGGLVLNPKAEPIISEEEVFTFLKRRKGLLDGVCITGGEPTLSPDLKDFIKKVKKMGYLVKLDTNGYQPTSLKRLLRENLLDMVAMDIKAPKETYARVAGLPLLDIRKIEESVELLMNGTIDYEFRTTVARQLQTKRDILAIGDWIAGCKAYYLQAYKESEQVIQPIYTSYTAEELKEMKRQLEEKIPIVGIRGID